MFFFSGVNHFRAIYDNAFSGRKSVIENATLGYVKNGDNEYDKTFEIKDEGTTTLSLPSQDTNDYYIFGDFLNYYKVDAFVNGQKVTTSINTTQRRNFWDSAYLMKIYVFELPKLEKNIPIELQLVTGNTSKKYTIKLK
ncbi:MAG: hypothetical protein ACRC68_00430 [Clostridium sp.]